MTRVLVLGTGPMLDGAERNFLAHSLRTWHLTKPLVDAGHEVLLYTLPSFTDKPETRVEPGVDRSAYRGLEVFHFRNYDDAFNLRELGEAAARFEPDCLLGINSYPSYVLAKLDSTAPLWADFNGSVVFEGQVKSYVYGNNAQLDFYWQMEAAAMRRADRFSTVSRRQFYALHGELAAVGRMNRHTFAYPFATTIPNAFNPFFADEANRALCKLRLRGEAFPADAFVLLWSGAYNSWTNVDVLMDALERAMAECPGLHYVSTGGQVYGHDDLTYPRVLSLIEASPYRDRFHLLGWVETSDLPGIYAQSDLGLCLDGRNFETMFGARNRVINMMAAGVACAMTDGTEIGEELVRAGSAAGFPPDDAGALARVIIEAYGDRDRVRELGVKGRDYVLDQFSYERTTRELRAWVAAPSHAPDNAVKLARAGRMGKRGAEAFALPTNPIEERLDTVVTLPEQPGIKRLLKLKIKAKARGLLGGMMPEKTEPALEEAALRVPIRLNPETTGEAALEYFRKLAPTLPRGATLAFGGDAIRHPDFLEIAQILAWPIRAARVQIHEDATAMTEGWRLEATCWALLEEGLPGRLEVLIPLDGLETTHNAIHGERAWANANVVLALLSQIRQRRPGRFEFGAVTNATGRNAAELDAVANYLRIYFPGARHIIRRNTEKPVS
ncbi:MAG: glycosyltransferase [Candidatus Sumerlaeia bacterium]